MSAHVTFKLQQLDGVSNWRTARERLRELHRLLAEELPVLPLWQTVDHFAYRKRIQGLNGGVVRLYQDVETWTLRARPQGGTP
jgi:ABC-type oligopeptide transport system substrate-binding subunit